MAELKLRRLHRGYVFTDFSGNEVGCNDSEQAMEEIKKLLESDKKSEEQIVEKPIVEKPIVEKPIVEKPIVEKPIVEKPIVEKRGRKPRQNTVELHRKIFEKAKEQINLTGKVNGAKISRELDINASNIGIHLKRMHDELEILIKKWQDEKDEKVSNVETGTNVDGNKQTV